MFYTLALTLVPGIGPVLARNLVSYCGSAEAVFKARRKQLLSVPGIGESAAQAILHHNVFPFAEAELRFMEQNNVQAYAMHDAQYPKRLQQCADAPLLLFVKGNADLNATRMLAVVGTRNASAYGKMVCEQLVEGLQTHGITIISGLAYGIDIATHKACVKLNVPTIGVLAHGLDRVYPYAHRDTAKKMIDNGALLTEFISGTNPDRQNFPRRNRIVAGMIDGLIVVETGISGGAVITALLADDYNRDVMAVPGQINHPFATGCHQLIKTNKASLITSAEDVLSVMGWIPEQTAGKTRQPELFPELSDDEQKIYTMLETGVEVYVDDLQQRSGLTPGTFAATILSLEFKNLITTLPGKRYQKM